MCFLRAVKAGVCPEVTHTVSDIQNNVMFNSTTSECESIAIASGSKAVCEPRDVSGENRAIEEFLDEYYESEESGHDADFADEVDFGFEPDEELNYDNVEEIPDKFDTVEEVPATDAIHPLVSSAIECAVVNEPCLIAPSNTSTCSDSISSEGSTSTPLRSSSSNISASPSGFKTVSVTKRAGIFKRANQKAANRAALGETVKFVKALSRRESPTSLKLIEDATEELAPFHPYAEQLQRIQIRLLKRAVVTVAHINGGKEPISINRITKVLALPTLRSCKSKPQMFRNRWKEENDAAISGSDLIVTVSREVYSVHTLTLMRCWHELIRRFRVIEDALLWATESPRSDHVTAENVFMAPPLPDIVKWVSKMPSTETETMSAMTLTGKELLDEICLNETIKTLAILYQKTAPFEMLPSNWLRLPALPPEFCGTSIPEAFDALQAASTQHDIPRLVAAINVDENHWCGMVIDIISTKVTIYDPEQDDDRTKRIWKLVQTQVVPHLPGATASDKYRLNIHYEDVVQSDNYNCGFFVLLFIEMFMTDRSVSEIVAGDVVGALDFFRYRYFTPVEGSRSS